MTVKSNKIIAALIASLMCVSAYGQSKKPISLPGNIDAGEEGVVAELLIDEKGVHSVSVAALKSIREFYGMRPENISVTHKGKNVGVKINNLDQYGHLSQTSTIEFVANSVPGEDDFYNESEIYRLEFRPDEKSSNPVKEVSGVALSGGVAPTHFMDEAIISQNKLYNVESSHESPWIMSVVQASGNQDGRYSTSVNLEGLYTGANVASKVTAVVAGKSSFSSTEKDHVVSVKFNGRTLMNQREFADKDLVSLTQSGKATQLGLRNGNNNVEIVVHSPISRGIFVDSVEVDAVKVEYPRRFDASSSLAFDGEALKYTVANATTNTRVYRVTKNAQGDDVVSLMTGIKPTNGSMTFNGVSQGEEAVFYVSTNPVQVGSADIRVPLGSEISGVSGNPYVVISNSDYMDNTALNSLVSAHNGELVNVLDIFYTYSNGEVSPDAIKDYLKEAYAAGTRYVLLADGIHHDFKANLNTTRKHQIPAQYVSTSQEKWVLSDNWYADVVGEDDLPDLAIGRFPVNNDSELTIIANKSISRLNASNGFTDKVLLVGDQDLGLGFDRYLNQLDENVFEANNKETESLLYTSNQRDTFTDDLVQSLEGNPDLVVYSGHSVPTKWGNRNNLLSAADVSKLELGTSAPVIIALGCFNTYVQSPNSDSVGRLLMVSPNGVSAIAGSTGLMSAYRVERYGHLVSENVVKGQSIGDAVMNAKRDYVELYNDKNFDVLHGQSLLGDPKNSM